MFWRRVRTLIQRLLFLPAQADRDIDDELRFHLSEETRLQVERGLPSDAAAAAARRAFGSVALAKENTRAVWVATVPEQLLQDLRFGSRILTRSPALSATAIILVALVIGGNTTVFSIAHGILSKPAPGVHAKRLATVSWVADNGEIETHTAYEVYSHFLEHSATVRPLAGVDFQRVTLTHENGSYAVRATIASPNYFETFGVRPAKGRSFTRDEAEGGSSGLVVVIAHHLWQNAFHGIDDIVGKTLKVNGQPATVVGVAAAGFRGAWLADLTDLWVPLVGEFRPWLQPNRSGVHVAMIGRLAPEGSIAEAQAELSGMWTQLQRADSSLNQKVRIRLVPYSATAGGNSIIATQGNRMLAIFSVVTLLTIAIVCANVANLLIARALVRQREVALRQSLGASRLRIIRSLLAEGLALSVSAWLAACGFAWVVSKAVPRLLVPEGQGNVSMPDLTPDWTVVGYALVLALLCTIAVTVGPALRTWRQQLLPFLKVGERGVVRSGSRLSRGLVVLQLAFSVLMLTTAGLAHRSLSLQDSLDVGFDSGNILLVTVNTSGSAAGPQSNRVLLDAIKARLGRLPSVESVSYAAGSRIRNWPTFPVRRDPSDEPVMADDNRVAPEYFSTLGVPLIAGRDFMQEMAPAVPTVIVNRQLAETLWPGQAAVGKRLFAGPPGHLLEAEVIGVARDALFDGRGSDAPPRYIFFPSAERPGAPGETTFFLRHRAPQETVGPAVSRALREVDSRVAIAGLRSFDSQVAADAAPVWMLTMLVTLFAGGSLLIAAIGQYAVVAFDGRRRSREFGVRIALGASSRQLMTTVMGESFRLTAIGLALGFVLSVGVGSVLARVLYGITATDPRTYTGVFLLLAVASLLACYLPARRAASTDPMLVLRTE